MSKISRKELSKLTIISMAGAILSVIYSILQARYFGVERQIEIFFGVSVLMTSVHSLAQAGQLGEIILPIYIRLKDNHGKEVGFEFFSVVFNWMLIGTSIIVGCCMLTSSLILSWLLPGFSESEQGLAVSMFYIVAPLVIIQILTYLVNVLLNAEKKYGWPEFFAFFHYFIAILILILLYEKLGIWTLILALLVGQLVQVIGFGVMLKRIKFRYFFKLSTEVYPMKKIFRELISTSFFAGSTQVYTFVMTASLSLLPPGFLAVYNYVQKLFGRVSIILLRPISIIAFTQFAENVTKKASVLKKSLTDALLLNLSISVICTTLTFTTGKAVLSFLWAGDKFGGLYVNFSYALLTISFLLLAMNTFDILYRKLLITLGYVSHQYTGAGIVQLISAFLAYYFIKEYRYYGIFALLASNMGLLFLVSTGLIYYLRRDLFFIYSFKRLFRWASVASLSGGIVYGATNLFNIVVGVSRTQDFFIAAVQAILTIVLIILFGLLFRIEFIEQTIFSIQIKFRKFALKMKSSTPVIRR